MILKLLRYFTKWELFLLSSSLVLILASFLLFDRGSYLTLIASLLGVTSLILGAKGNPIGPLLMIVFSLLYAIISYGFAYYGEMITYLGMSAPMAAFSLFAWLKNPYNGQKSEVKAHAFAERISGGSRSILCLSRLPFTSSFGRSIPKA